MGSQFPLVELTKEYANNIEGFVVKIQEENGDNGGALVKIADSIKNKPLTESDVVDFDVMYRFQRKEKRTEPGVYHHFNDNKEHTCKVHEYFNLVTSSNSIDIEKLTDDEIKQLTKDAWQSYRKGGDENFAEDIPYAYRHDSNTRGEQVDLEENNRTLNMFPEKLDGICTCDQYVGKPGTVSPFHVEDMDLFSLNYLFFGLKLWYFIKPKHHQKFMDFVKGE
jgi:hypothetical protein